MVNYLRFLLVFAFITMLSGCDNATSPGTEPSDPVLTSEDSVAVAGKPGHVIYLAENALTFKIPSAFILYPQSGTGQHRISTYLRENPDQILEITETYSDTLQDKRNDKETIALFAKGRIDGLAAAFQHIDVVQDEFLDLRGQLMLRLDMAMIAQDDSPLIASLLVTMLNNRAITLHLMSHPDDLDSHENLINEITSSLKVTDK